jgi:uncharacterized protein (TIGR03382 family)
MRAFVLCCLLCPAVAGATTDASSAPPPPLPRDAAVPPDAGFGAPERDAEVPADTLVFAPRFVDFGEVPVGETRRIPVRVTTAGRVVIENIVVHRGAADVAAVEDDCPRGEPLPAEGCAVTLTWTPAAPGPMQMRVLFEVEGPADYDGFAAFGESFDPDAPDEGVPGPGGPDGGAGGAGGAGGEGGAGGAGGAPPDAGGVEPDAGDTESAADGNGGGCSASGAPGGWAALLLGTLLAARRRRTR